jgi:steroid delta-isomerase-like uncharacterized protein
MAILKTIRRCAVAGLWPAIFMFAVSCGPRPPDNSAAVNERERNKAVIRHWIDEGFNKQNLAVVDELFAEQFAVNGRAVGRDGLKGSMRRHLVGFPDLHVTIDDIVAEGNKVGIWYTVEGTHRGEFEGIPPTGNHVTWSGFDLVNVKEGKIADARFLSDLYGLLAQLGATVAPSANADGARR